MATMPQTAPTEMPTADGLPFRIQSVNIQLTPAAAAARFVTTSALHGQLVSGEGAPRLKPEPAKPEN